jgi:hypothetical protein
MDEGLPIAYEVLEEGVPVYAAGGETVGTVAHVVAAPSEDIFHGIVVSTADGERFVPASNIASLHERGVDLSIDASAAAELSPPDGGAPAWRISEPGAKPSRWRHLLDELEGVGPVGRDWSRQD